MRLVSETMGIVIGSKNIKPGEEFDYFPPAEVPGDDEGNAKRLAAYEAELERLTGLGFKKPVRPVGRPPKTEKKPE